MRRLSILLILTLLPAVINVSSAQEEEQDDTNRGVWINEYTEGADMLSYAAREISKGSYKPAIEVYQGLIEKVRKEKEFASRVVSAGEGMYLPLRKRCYEEILSLPREGREMYGILYDAKAQRIYEEAASKQDITTLVLVAQDYLLTEAGKKACLLLADLCLEKAEYSLALHYLDTLANYHCRGQEEPALCVMKRAACLLQSGEMDAAKKMIANLKSDSLDENGKRICGCLLNMTKTAHAVKKESFNTYYDNFINLKTPPPVKLVEKPGKDEKDTLDWRFPVERKSQQNTSRGYRIIADGARGFDLYPVYYNNLLFINDSTRIYALAAEGGKIKWREPDDDSSGIAGLPLGSFIHDGKLFAILRNNETYTRTYNPRGGGKASRAINELYCFDADKFGDNPPEWHTGPLRDTTDLKETSFTSVPYVDGSRVYVTGIEITDQDKNYCISCFSTTGNFLWESRFCATKWTGQEPLLRAASLVISRGKVIVCTNVGVAASFSAFTGDLEWIYKYPLQSAANVAPNRGMMTAGGIITWQPQPPIVWHGTHPADGKPCETLILTPADSDFIMGFDTASRRLLWRWERTNHEYVIGPRGEDIFVYGGNSLENSSDTVVRQHRIPDGLIRWEAKIPPEAFDQTYPRFGKGVATPDALYIPCSKQLLKIVDGKDEKRYFGKVTKAGTWYSLEEETKTTEKPQPQQPSGRVIMGRGYYPGQQQQVPGEKRLCGNILLLPDKIITSGYSWTNCFKQREEKNK